MEKKGNEEGINQSNDSSVLAYFAYYSKLFNQQNMLGDYTRTSTYYTAISSNSDDFKDKIVLDVGTGSGILAIFAAKAGAKKVYAVEASDSINYAKELIKHNKLDNIITMIHSKIEEVKDNQIEPIDVIISEPLGTLLINERMLESLLFARDKFLKPNGKIFPNESTISFMPFSDENLYQEQLSKVGFWLSKNFYGVDMTSLYQKAYIEKFSQPVIDAYDPNFHDSYSVSNSSCQKTFDFTTIDSKDLIEFKVDFTFKMNKEGFVHGIAGWFDTVFTGTNQTIILSTSPQCPVTHWYQTRLLFTQPIYTNTNQELTGVIKFIANNDQSYQIDLQVGIKCDDIAYQNCSYNLKEPEFRGITYNPYYNNSPQS